MISTHRRWIRFQPWASEVICDVNTVGEYPISIQFKMELCVYDVYVDILYTFTQNA